MKLLCIDTATEHGTVAVTRDDGSCASVCWRSSGRNAENLFGYIESALSEADVSREELVGIGVVTGPGGFTSLRVGLATAKGLALGLDLPIVGVSSLRVIARSIEVSDPDTVRVPIMKAYRGDVLAAAYTVPEGGLDELVPPILGSPADVLEQIRRAVGDRPISRSGEGYVIVPEALVAEVLLVMRTEGPADLASLEPHYLRPSDATLPERPLSTKHVDRG
ncbi:MAG: hypothetical protein AMJ62_05000 [Myxococcales bacterium SG8_38]|nr:MAG: hypothetical protein AMJ62_05000 [Myxococcales bacterium SG8_38]